MISPQGSRSGVHSAALLAALLALPPAGVAHTQDTEDPSPHSNAELVSEVGTIAPGRPFTIALRLTMDPRWHSYWRNPGDAGGTTTIEWHLPEGFTSGDIQWPHPRRIEAPPLVSYGYDEEVLLLVDITPPPSLAEGAVVTLAARADWVVCEEICLPAAAELELRLRVRAGPVAPNPRWSDAFAATRRLLPVRPDGWEIRAWRGTGDFVLAATAPEGWDGSPEGVYFFPARAGTIAHAAPQALSRDGRTFRLSLVTSEYLHESVSRLEGVLLAPPGTSWRAGVEAPALAVDAPVTIGPPTAAVTLITALLFAIAGGLILNLMPCVFPVLSIKILGFVEQGGADRTAIRAHGLAFAGGVITSFGVLGAILLGIRAGGTLVGWGFQLQSPAFVAFLATLFFVLGLSLLGALDVGTSLTRLGALLGPSGGFGTSFASGVLATLVATPCIAPLMGVALGYALTQPPLPTLLIFVSLGLGMALPYVALTAHPALLSRLPRAGGWMVTLRQLLAFPLFATALWLVWVFGRQTGLDGATFLAGALLLLAFAIWVVWRWPRSRVRRRRWALSRGLAAAAAVAAALLALRGTASQPTPVVDDTWQPFSSAHVAGLRASGRPVFIDFTAAWCLTCKVNERVVLATDEIEQAFRQRGVTLFKADWTRQDPEITRALESFGRSGVPLYVLYPGGRYNTAVVLPVILTKDIVLDALEGITMTKGTPP